MKPEATGVQVHQFISKHLTSKSRGMILLLWNNKGVSDSTGMQQQTQIHDGRTVVQFTRLSRENTMGERREEATRNMNTPTYDSSFFSRQPSTFQREERQKQLTCSSSTRSLHRCVERRREDGKRVLRGGETVHASGGAPPTANEQRSPRDPAGGSTLHIQRCFLPVYHSTGTCAISPMLHPCGSSSAGDSRSWDIGRKDVT